MSTQYAPKPGVRCESVRQIPSKEAQRRACDAESPPHAQVWWNMFVSNVAASTRVPNGCRHLSCGQICNVATEHAEVCPSCKHDESCNGNNLKVHESEHCGEKFKGDHNESRHGRGVAHVVHDLKCSVNQTRSSWVKWFFSGFGDNYTQRELETKKSRIKISIRQYVQEGEQLGYN